MKRTRSFTGFRPVFPCVTFFATLTTTILTALSVFFPAATGFAQDNPLFRHLPPDAGSIYHINIPAITTKLSWPDLASLFPAVPGRSGQEMIKIMQTPSGAGIDMQQDFFVAASSPFGGPGDVAGDSPFRGLGGGAADSVGFTTFILHLKDPAKWAATLRRQFPGLRIRVLTGKIRSASKDNLGAAWNKDIVVIVEVKPSLIAHPASIAHYTALALQRSLAALAGFTTSFYTSDPTFRTGFSDDADLHIWAPQGEGLSFVTRELLHSNPLGGIGGRRPGTGTARTKTHSLIALRFEAGRIILRSSASLTPVESDLYAKFGSRPLDTDLIARIPKANLLALVNLHFDPSVIAGILDKYKYRNKVDSQVTSKGLTLDTLLHIFKGDFLLAAMGPQRDQPATSSSDSIPARKQPSLYFVATIDDLSAYKKLAARFSLLKDSTDADSTNPGRPSGDSSGHKIDFLASLKAAHTLQDHILVISDAQSRTDAFFSNTEKRDTDFVTEQMKDNPFSIWIDFKMVGNFLQHMKDSGSGPQEPPSEKNRQLLHIFSALDQLIISGGVVRDGKLETWIELKMADPSENSLRSLFKLFH